MVFGHNSNLKLGNITFHVQTEDRGESHALLDTTVYYRGRVLHRRTNNYFDLLPLNDDRAQALKLRLEEQHRTVMDEIRSGALELPIPPEPAPPVKPANSSPDQAPPAAAHLPSALHLELVNAKTWLSGKRANLLVLLKDSNGNPVPDGAVTVEVAGADQESIYLAQTSAQGNAKVEFDLPRIASADAALVVKAEKGDARAVLRFALRAKPRVSSI
jgi:hypothetical protein